MSTVLENIPGIEMFIREKIEVCRKTHKDISDEIKQLYPSLRGLSAMSIRCFCNCHDIHKTARLDASSLDRIVSINIMKVTLIIIQTTIIIYFAKVGKQYGRKTMAGLLNSQGYRTAENRIGLSLHRLQPRHHQQRCVLTQYRLSNPVPYSAKYFGHKVHIDQNEKLCMFGVTHIMAVDGFSGKIVALSTMPVKNCNLIYEHINK